MKLSNFTIAFLVLVSAGCSEERVKLNHLQVIGSHNSYKRPIDKELLQLIAKNDSLRALTLDYDHISLTDQLDLGLRSLELDVLYDPQGGRFSSPQGLKLLGKSSLDFDVEGRLKEPGLKVLHIPDIDFRSSCFLFKDCLQELRNWSDLNPDHTPIIITINAKDDTIAYPGFTPPLPFTNSALDSIDQEILSVFDMSQLITPDLVKGNEKDLETAILTIGRPYLSAMAGRFIFVLDEQGDKLRKYIDGRPSLSGRVMFVSVDVGNPEAAFHIINDPIKDGGRIRDLVSKGYLVRTRADANTWEAREGDYRRMIAALESGAQVITTDYYLERNNFNTGYRVIFDNGKFIRCNPLLEEVNCLSDDVNQ